MSHSAPDDIANVLRDELDKPGRSLSISEVQDGPPSGGVEISVTGPNYDDISSTSEELFAALSTIEGIVNLENTVSKARDEISIQVDPEKAARIGLTTRQVGLQLSQYLIGQTVTTMTVDGETVDVVLVGDPRSAAGIDKIRSLVIVGPAGAAPLGDLAEPVVREGPVSISRTDGVRSASITGDIIVDDTQGVGVLIDEKIAGPSAASRRRTSPAAASLPRSRRVSRPSSSPWPSASSSSTSSWSPASARSETHL